MKTKEEILVITLEISESMLMEDIVSIWSDELKAMEEYATQQCAAKDAEIEKLKENWNEYDQLIKDYAYQSSEIERLKGLIKKHRGILFTIEFILKSNNLPKAAIAINDFLNENNL